MYNSEMYVEMKRLLNSLKRDDVEISMLDTKSKALKNEVDTLSQINELLVDKNDILKNDSEALHINANNLKRENDVLKEEIKELKERIDNVSQSLNNTFNKFDENDRKLSMLISNQGHNNGKYRLGFEHENNNNLVKKHYFVKAKEVMNQQSSVIKIEIVKTYKC